MTKQSGVPWEDIRAELPQEVQERLDTARGNRLRFWHQAKDLTEKYGSENWTFELREAIVDLANQARSQAYEEAIKIVDRYSDTIAMAGEKGDFLPIAPFISKAIRQHSQKGEGNE